MTARPFITVVVAGVLCSLGCTEVRYIYPEEEEFIEDICIYIPDSGFREYCYAEFDIDKNGMVSSSEANAVTEIDFRRFHSSTFFYYENDFYDLTGTEFFPNLHTIYASDVEKIDLTKNAKLKLLYLINPRSAVDFSCNMELERICLHGSEELVELDLSNYSKITAIDSMAFFSCTSLKSVILPEWLTSIGGEAFDWDEALTTITIPDNVEYIGEVAFGQCYGLNSVYLPKNLKRIGGMAFHVCESLKFVYSKAPTPPILEDYIVSADDIRGVFYGIDPSAILYVPSESIDAYKKSDWAQFFAEILPLE